MLNDSDLIESYLQWIRKTICTESVAKTAFDSWMTKFKEPRYKPLEPWNPALNEKRRKIPDRFWQTKKINLIRSLWDSNCDKLLAESVAKFAWDWSLYFEKMIRDYLSPDMLKTLNRASNNDQNLFLFSEKRLFELGIEIPEPSLLKCAGCGINFMNWSVDPRLGERVGYKILFCQDCYYKASYGLGNPSADKDTMLEQLSIISNIIGTVPNSSFLRNLKLINLSEDNQVTLIKTLLAMPSYEKFVDEFDSWLQALILAGVLEGGVQRTPRGVRCIANDGHVCNSLAEKTIDDWLHVRNIQHEKEPVYPYHVHLNPSRMRADWKVKDVLIEYAGLMDDPTYATKMKTKQDLAKNFGISLIVLEPEDILDLEIKLETLLSEQE